MAQPKILIISGSYPDIKCGVGDCVAGLIESLIKKNIEVKLLTSRDPLVRNEKYVYAVIKKWNLVSIFKITRFINKNKPNLINLHIPTLKYKAILNFIVLLPLLSKTFFKSISFIVTLHDYAIATHFFKLFFLPLFLFSDIIILTNDEDIYSAIKTFPMFKNKIRKIRLGYTKEVISISANEIKEFCKKINYAEGNSFISTFGFLKKDRHIDTVIRVFRQLNNYDKQTKLLILGNVQMDRDIKYKNSLFDLTKKLSIEDRVYWLGYCDMAEITFYLSISRISLLFYERGASFRRSSLINSIVRRVPTITNVNRKYGIDKELVNSGMVLIVNSLDVDEIYKKVRLVLYYKDCAKELKRKMEGADKIFSWDIHADRIIEAYHELITKR